MQQIIQNGTQAVSIYANQPEGPFYSNLYVNCAAERLGDITPINAKHKSLKGAIKWASKQVAQ